MAQRPPSKLKMPAPRSGLRPPSSLPQAPCSANVCGGAERQATIRQAGASGIQPPASRLQPPTSGLQPPPSRLQPPTSGLQPPSSRLQPPASRLPPPVSRLQPPAARPPQPIASSTGARPKQPSVPRQRPQPGQYLLPAEYGPATLKGKHLTYSSPPELRPTMESKLTKELKYFSNAPPPGVGRERQLLENVEHLADTLSGSFQIYGVDAQGAERDVSFGANKSFLNRVVRQLDDLDEESESPTRHADATPELMRRARQQPDSRVDAKATGFSTVPAPIIMTPEGPQQVIQQSVLERTVERTEDAERIAKHLTLIDVNERTGVGKQVELDQQQRDPDYGVEEGFPSEAVSVKSTVSITEDFQQVSKTVTRERIGDLTKTDKDALRVDPAKVAELVAAENEDVEDTLKLLPPDLELTPERFTLKKRLTNLRLNSESVALLEESVVRPSPTGDEAQAEAAPEVIATILDAVEKDVSPQSAPNRVFNSLFTETTDDKCVPMTSVAAGPLQDIVVPTEIPQSVHNAVLTDEMHELTEHFNKTEERPQENAFTETKPEVIIPKRRLVIFKPVDMETAPWGEEDLEPAMNLVGAEPVSILGATNVQQLEKDGQNIASELSAGIEYFLDTDPVQYVSRVQLRGSVPPDWFPGYMVALPEYPEIIKIAKSPNEVFFSAWKSVQPKIIPSEDNITF